MRYGGAGLIAAVLAAAAPHASARSAPAPAGPSAAAAAQTPPDPLGLDAIVVTAAARPAGGFDSASSVSVLSAGQMAEGAPRSTAEVFRQFPGLRAEASGGEGNANIAVRGLPVAAGGAKFLQLQEDGLPLVQFGDIAFANADIFLRADQSIAAIQAVRGGLASTFASNTPGGVINFISRTGEQAGGIVMATAGVDYGEARLDFDYGGPLDAATRFNVGGFWRRGEGPRLAGYAGNRGYQLKANLTREFSGGYLRLQAKRLDDRAIGYLPMPMRVTGTNADPHFASLPGFDLRRDTPHSAFFPRDTGLDGDNRLSPAAVGDGMHPVVTALGFEAAYSPGWGLKLENRFRWTAIHGGFVAPFPAEVGGAQALADAVGEGLTDAGGPYRLAYASGPAAGQPLDPAQAGGNGLLMRVHLFDTRLKDLGSLANELRMTKTLGRAEITAGFYKARQTIAMDWVWNSYLLEVKGRNAALVDVVSPGGTVLTRGGLYAYGVPFWGNCCQRRYDVTYDIDAPFAALTYAAGPWTLDASLRHDHLRARGTYAGTLQAAGYDVNGDGTIQPVEASVSLVDNAAPRPVDYAVGYTSWSVGANYRFAPGGAVFARASRGGRANADRLLFGVVRPDGSVRRDDAVDFVNQYELGLKLRRGRLELAVTGFHAVTQEQNFELTSGRFLDRTYRATGVELEGAWHSGRFDLRGGATWTHARIASDAITPANAGHVPRRQAALVYQLTPSLDWGVLRLGLNLVGTTSAYAQDENALVLPGYAVVNAFLVGRLGHGLEVSLRANNLFDAVGITEAEEGAIADNSNAIVRARAITGRTVSASLAYQF